MGLSLIKFTNVTCDMDTDLLKKKFKIPKNLYVNSIDLCMFLILSHVCAMLVSNNFKILLNK